MADRILQITLGGVTATIDDLKYEDLVTLFKETGCNYADLLSPLDTSKDPDWYGAIARLFLTRFGGHTPESAKALVDSMSMRQIVASLDWVDDDRPIEHTDGIPVVDPKTGGVETSTP
jgi:hypothetical protein